MDLDRVTVVSSLFDSVSRVQREIETKTLCKLSETGEIFTRSLNGRLNLPLSCLRSSSRRTSDVWTLKKF